MTKKVFIIGAGLCGVLTAIKCHENGYKVHIVERSSKILSSFSSVELSGFSVNPGFYAAEYPRAKEIIRLFQKVSNSDGIITPQERYLLVKDSLIKESWPIQKWPTFALDSIPHSKKTYRTIDDCENNISPKYLNLLKKESHRYEPWYLHRNNILPWFLPYNIDIVSDDEGSKYRSQVRSGDIQEFIYQPSNGLFSSLAKDLENYIKDMGIELHLNINIDLQSPIESLHQIFNTDRISKLIFAAPCQALLTYSNPSLLKELGSSQFTRVICIGESSDSFIPQEMTQTLILSSIAPDLARISNISSFDFNGIDPKRYLFEFQVSGRWDYDDTYLRFQAKTLFRHMNSDLAIHHFSSIGSGFIPSLEWYEIAKNSVNQWISQNKLSYNIEPYFGPINMAKAWMMSDKLSK